MKIQNLNKSYKRNEKGRYAYSTDRRRLVWEDVMWPLITELDKSFFTLKEYQAKRDEVCTKRNITPRQISGGFVSLINKGIINHQQERYSIHYKLIPLIKKDVDLNYGTVLKEIGSKRIG